MSERGAIHNQRRAAQLRDFTGLRYNYHITPTDIDCLTDFGSEAFVIVETKLSGVDMKDGQRRAIAALVDTLNKGGARAVGLFAVHDTPHDIAIDVANCVVREYYRAGKPGKWHHTEDVVTVRFVTDWFLKNWGLHTYLKGVA